MSKTKKLDALSAFYIDGHPEMNEVELARTTGLSVRQVRMRRNKVVGKNREGQPKSEEMAATPQIDTERTAKIMKEADKIPQPPGPQLPADNRPVPGLRVENLIARRAGTASLTQAASEIGDILDGVAPNSQGPKFKQEDPFDDPSKVHRIK